MAAALPMFTIALLCDRFFMLGSIMWVICSEQPALVPCILQAEIRTTLTEAAACLVGCLNVDADQVVDELTVHILKVLCMIVG